MFHLSSLLFFNRDECDRLSNILKSRVIEAPINITRDGGEASEIPERGATGGIILVDFSWGKKKWNHISINFHFTH